MKDDTTPQEGRVIWSRGAKFPFRGDILPPRVRQAVRANRYEFKEVEAAMSIVGKEDVVLELGGGMGYVSTVLAKNNHPKHIHVYEANPVMADYIRETHAINGLDNTTLHNALLGPRKAKAKFHIREQFVASSLDYKDGADVVRTESIDVHNAKTAMKDIAPTVLVCDIEGAEVDVIPLLDLSTVRAAVIELHPQWIGPEGVNTVFQAFMNAGLAYSARRSQKKVIVFKRSWPLR